MRLRNTQKNVIDNLNGYIQKQYAFHHACTKEKLMPTQEKKKKGLGPKQIRKYPRKKKKKANGPNKLGNIRKVPKSHRMIAPPEPPPIAPRASTDHRRPHDPPNHRTTATTNRHWTHTALKPCPQGNWITAHSCIQVQAAKILQHLLQFFKRVFDDSLDIKRYRV